MTARQYRGRYHNQSRDEHNEQRRKNYARKKEASAKATEYNRIMDEILKAHPELHELKELSLDAYSKQLQQLYQEAVRRGHDSVQ